jgi:hypothetical protein
VRVCWSVLEYARLHPMGLEAEADLYPHFSRTGPPLLPAARCSGAARVEQELRVQGWADLVVAGGGVARGRRRDECPRVRFFPRY